jgi:hypothetical protein
MRNPIIEEIQATGNLKGVPVPPNAKLDTYFDRLEFSHGHNTLLFTGLMRLGSFSPKFQPYVGIGAGVSMPHPEIWLKGDANKGGEYQIDGPAGQLIFGIEFPVGAMSYFIEYKFTMAFNSGRLTGQNGFFTSGMIEGLNFFADPLRQLWQWWNGVEPKYGRYRTILAAHQFVGGVGVRLSGAAPATHPTE